MATKKTVPSTLAILKCSLQSHKAVKEYSAKTRIPMVDVVNDMVNDWMPTVGAARLQAIGAASKITVSQFEKS